VIYIFIYIFVSGAWGLWRASACASVCVGARLCPRMAMRWILTWPNDDYDELGPMEAPRVMVSVCVFARGCSLTLGPCSVLWSFLRALERQTECSTDQARQCAALSRSGAPARPPPPPRNRRNNNAPIIIINHPPPSSGRRRVCKRGLNYQPAAPAPRGLPFGPAETPPADWPRLSLEDPGRKCAIQLVCPLGPAQLPLT